MVFTIHIFVYFQRKKFLSDFYLPFFNFLGSWIPDFTLLKLYFFSSVEEYSIFSIFLWIQMIPWDQLLISFFSLVFSCSKWRRLSDDSSLFGDSLSDESFPFTHRIRVYWRFLAIFFYFIFFSNYFFNFCIFNLIRESSTVW